MANVKPDLDQKVLARIKNGVCAACGNNPGENSVVVMDARYGKVRVCGAHNVARAAIKEGQP